MAVSGTNTHIWSATAAGDTIGRGKLWAIRWYGSTTAGDDLIIEDGDSNVIFTAKASGANADIAHYYPGITFSGITVRTIDAGTVEFTVL